jgi:hypothetical protein
MNNTKLVMPGVIDLVAIERVEMVMQRELTEITTLATEAQGLSATVAALEARVREERIDPETALWMYVRLQAFLADLREEAEQEAAVIVEAARRDAERIRRGGKPFALSFTGALAARRARADLEEPIRWIPASIGPSAAPATVVTVTAHTPTVIEAPVVASAPEPEHFPAPAAAATVLGEGLIDPLAGTTDEQFWATVDAQPWWRRRRKVASTSAVLQTAAALAAVAAVAIHFA